MQDFLENKIEISDDVIYLKLMQTGRSSSRKIMFKGKVIGFKGKKVEIERLYTNEFKVEKGIKDTVFPRDIVVLKEMEHE